MRTETIISETMTRAQAVEALPWAAKVVKVDGGWMGFESVADYETWAKQV